MRIVNKGKVFALVLLCVLTVFNVSSVFATAIVYGSEEKGYLVSSQQLREKVATYNASALNATYKNYAAGGAKLWSNAGVVTFKESRDSLNIIYTIDDKNTKVNGTCKRTKINSNGKIIAFEIMYNHYYLKSRSDKKNKATAAHEFGHALGLQDLYNDYNCSQLMCGNGRRTTMKPSAKDIKGAKYATRK